MSMSHSIDSNQCNKLFEKSVYMYNVNLGNVSWVA